MKTHQSHSLKFWRPGVIAGHFRLHRYHWEGRGHVHTGWSVGTSGVRNKMVLACFCKIFAPWPWKAWHLRTFYVTINGWWESLHRGFKTFLYVLNILLKLIYSQVFGPVWVKLFLCAILYITDCNFIFVWIMYFYLCKALWPVLVLKGSRNKNDLDLNQKENMLGFFCLLCWGCFFMKACKTESSQQIKLIFHLIIRSFSSVGNIVAALYFYFKSGKINNF